jgi:L-iditol 2-dehydrogenase
MKAVVYYAPGDIRVEDVATPQAGAEELRVKVDACAVCGTDLKSYKHGNPRIKAPLPMGHEFTGVIDTVGERVRGFAVGERIVMATSVSCGRCRYCREGWRNLCVDLAPMGFSYPGGMAEYTVIPARALENGHVVKVPAGIPAEQAALAEPLSCAVNSVRQCELRPGDVVVVLGAGPMGLMNACVARAMGAGKIILSEVSAARLAQAAQFGCDLLIDPSREDLVARVKAVTEGGLGADAVIVAAPAAGPQEIAPDLVRRRGTVCLFASLPVGQSMLQVDSRKIHYGELRVIGTSDSTPEHVREAVALMAAKAVPTEKFATHVLPLDGIFQAYELMLSGEALRVVLRP